MGYLKENVKPNYDKFPRVEVPGRADQCLRGWLNIMEKLGTLAGSAQTTVVFECYQGVHDD